MTIHYLVECWLAVNCCDKKNNQDNLNSLFVMYNQFQRLWINDYLGRQLYSRRVCIAQSNSEFILLSECRRQRELIWNDTGFWNLKVFLQCYIFTNKAKTSNIFQTVPRTGDKVFKHVSLWGLLWFKPS